MGAVRIETDATIDLAGVLSWIAQHRGQVVELDDTRRIALGSPITAPRAVIVAVVLEDDQKPGPQLGGVLRALSNRIEAKPARLVFEGRSPSGLAFEEARRVAGRMLDAISEQLSMSGEVANVA